MNIQADTVTIPGTEIGTIILNSTCIFDAPSIYAASRIAFGIDTKKVFHRKYAKRDIKGYIYYN